MNDTRIYTQKLLEGWEDVHKKSQLTLWILLSLKASSKHMAEIKEWIVCTTKDTITADDKSMYRALRRLHEAEVITYRQVPGNSGPDRKAYALTDIGTAMLHNFLQRNIIDVFYNPSIRNLIEKDKEK